MNGKIIKGIAGYYYVEAGNNIYECRARGIFRNNKIIPLVGDMVEIDIIDEENKKGNVQKILTRKNLFIRPQVANIDNIVIVVSATKPKLDIMLLDKLLVMYQIEGVMPVICINKTDEIDEYNSSIKDIYQKAGYTVFETSAKQNIGIDSLKSMLKDKTSILTGQSGVGKSSLINKILDKDVFEIGNLSEKISRGKNTTRHTELIELSEGGYIIDSPGFSSISIDKINCQELQMYYPEFLEYIGTCKFTGCSHLKEIGCKIKEALDLKKIDEGRYERYKEIYNNLKNKTKLM